MRVGGDSNPPTAEDQHAHSGGVGVATGSPRIVTEEKLKCYDKFRHMPIMIEGPEFIQDFSYFL